MTKQRLEAERLIYKVFDTLDPSSSNTDFWKKKFSKMSDSQFTKYISSDFPFYFQTNAFIEPEMHKILEALKILNVPATERVYTGCTYRDSNGRPMKTKECLVVYLPIKRMKQMLIKKNGMSTNIDMRDMRTGLLTGVDKNGKESDREMESLAIGGLDYTMKELSRSRADSMDDKATMISTISNLGQVYLKDLPDDPTDSLSKNLLSTYFLGAQLLTNLVSEDYYLPKTLKDKKNRGVSREN